MTGFGDLNLKFPLILTISVFMSNLNVMVNSVEHEKTNKFYNPRVNYLCPSILWTVLARLVCTFVGGFLHWHTYKQFILHCTYGIF